MEVVSRREPNPAKSLLPARALDNSLTAINSSFTTETLDFSCLKGITPKDVLTRNPQESDLVPKLRKLCLLTQSAMIHMNNSCPGLPPDSIERTIELVTQSGAKVVVLKGRLNHRNEEPEVLGYGIVMLGRGNIIDAYHIPETLLTKEDACRVIRLFVTTSAREFLPRGEAFSKIFDEIKIMSGNGLLIGMVLTNIHSNTNKDLNPNIWLEAKSALEARGFAKTGFGFKETIAPLEIDFEWWTWSRSSPATQAQEKFVTKVGDLEHYKRERLAPLVPAIPLSSGLISVHGRPTHGFDIAKAYAGNLVIAPKYQPEDRTENSHNLIKPQADISGAYVEAGKLDASIVMGALPDIIKLNRTIDPNVAIENFFLAQHQQLRSGGNLVIRDSVAPEDDCLVEIRLAPKEAQLWKTYIQNRTERHIPNEIWNSITAIKSAEANREVWSTPLSIAMEFMNKFPYSSELESSRSYTVLNSSERKQLLEKTGFKIVFDAPVKSPRYENRAFKGKVELYDLQGKQLKYPSLMQVTVAEKVADSEAVGVTVVSDSIKTSSSFLKVKRFETKDQSGQVLGIQEIVTRNSKNSVKLVSLDVLPHFMRNEAGKNRLYFGARVTPRPLIALKPEDGIDSNIFHVEQIGAISSQEILDDDKAISNASISILAERAGISPSKVLNTSKISQGYTRPDSIDELVLMQAVETEQSYWEGLIDNPIYKFASRPNMRTFEASRYLQGCQSGIFQDRRLELMLYQVALEKGAEIGSWLGDKFELREQEISRIASLEALLSKAKNQDLSYNESNIPFGPQFFEVRQVKFEEHSRDNNILGSSEIEYVQTAQRQKFGNTTISVLPISKQGADYYVGLELRDFIAPYLHKGQSKLLTLPTLRTPNHIRDFDEMARWTKRRLKDYFGMDTNTPSKLGGKYFTSPGCTPEVIQPTICAVDQNNPGNDSIAWINLKDLLNHATEISCLQLRTAIYRASHMFGLISPTSEKA